MSTETQTTSNIPIVGSAPSPLETVAAIGLLWSFYVHYVLAILVVDETVGSQFAARPSWFSVGLNTALAVPIVLSMVLAATWAMSAFTDSSPSYRTAVVYGVPGSIIGVQPWFWAVELGVI